MQPKITDTHVLAAPMADLERHLIATYLAGGGHDYHTLMMRDDPESKKLLTAASLYASERLTEIETRSHYLKALHGFE